MDATAGEVCARKVGMVEARPEEVSPAEVRPAEVCLAEARLGRFAPRRFVPLRFASRRFASLRSGRVPGFSSRHRFQASTPCLSNATCSSFAMRAPRIVVRPNDSTVRSGVPQDKKGFRFPPSRPI